MEQAPEVRLAWAMLLIANDLMDGKIEHEEWEVGYNKIVQEIQDLGLERKVWEVQQNFGR